MDLESYQVGQQLEDAIVLNTFDEPRIINVRLILKDGIEDATVRRLNELIGYAAARQTQDAGPQ